MNELTFVQFQMESMHRPFSIDHFHPKNVPVENPKETEISNKIWDL